MFTIKLNGSEYPLACTLRVAYDIQNQNNHKPYTEVLSSIGDMTLEQQIDVLYAAFHVANKNVDYSKEVFRVMLLDDPEFNAGVMMELLERLIAGIYGKDVAELRKAAQDAESEDSAKND